MNRKELLDRLLRRQRPADGFAPMPTQMLTDQEANGDYRVPPMHPCLRIQAVAHLRRSLNDEFKKGLRAAIAIDPEHWWALIHFGAGMHLRNLLRKAILDDRLPTGNWDDYYVSVVEEAVREA